MAYKHKSKSSISSTISKQQQREVYPVDAYLKSDETKRMYIWHFNRFLKYFDLKEDSELLGFDTKKLESMIIEYLFDHLTKEGLKKRTVQMAMSAIFRFCMMNDLYINKQKISMQIQRDENHTEDRAYTQDEIKELLRQSTDERFRAVIYLMASTGMRVGAIPELELRDLIPKSIGPHGEILDGDAGVEKLYQIRVYNRSAENKYYCFCTPECRQAIDRYLASRADKGENVSINSKNTAPLIREQFSQEDVLNPKKLSVYTFKKAIGRTIKRAGLKTTGEVAMTHGLRKWAITQLIKTKVPYEVREFVSGHRHSRGLDTSYDRLSPNERLEMWAPAINYLTIDDSLKLNKELQVVKNEQDKKIALVEARNTKLENELKARDEEWGILKKEMLELKKTLSAIDDKDLKHILVNNMYQETAAAVLDQHNDSFVDPQQRGEDHPFYNSKTYKQWMTTKKKKEKKKESKID